MRRFLAAIAPLTALTTLAALCASVPAPAQQPSPAPAPTTPARAVPSPGAAGAAPAPAGVAPASAGTDPASAAPAPAAPVYRIELIVFRTTAAIGAPEDWGAEAGAQSPAPGSDADPGGASVASGTGGGGVAGGAGSGTDGGAAGSASATAIAAAAAQLADQRSSVHLLPASEFQLDRIASRLRSSGRYVPVAHVAWSQTASPWGRPIEIPVQSLGIDAQGLTGTVALERGEFLHLALLLDYAMDSPPPGLDAAPGTVFTLHDSHRVRFYERNYFDHPAFGVIALVTPEKAPRRPQR